MSYFDINEINTPMLNFIRYEMQITLTKYILIIILMKLFEILYKTSTHETKRKLKVERNSICLEKFEKPSYVEM